jgi:hypothetical protein
MSHVRDRIMYYRLGRKSRVFTLYKQFHPCSYNSCIFFKFSRIFLFVISIRGSPMEFDNHQCASIIFNCHFSIIKICIAHSNYIQICGHVNRIFYKKFLSYSLTFQCIHKRILIIIIIYINNSRTM